MATIEDHPHALPIPPVATLESMELMRIWEQATGKITVALTLRSRDGGSKIGDPIGWGVVLHDAAKIVASAYADKVRDGSGKSPDRQWILERIVRSFLDEHDKPTTTTSEVPTDGGS